MNAEAEKKHDFTIVVNMEQKPWDKEKISYQQVVDLAFPNPPPPPPGSKIGYTVEYAKGPPQNPKGSMNKGDHVYVTNGMVFTVDETGRS